MRAALRGRELRIVALGSKNSILVELLDTGRRVVTSRWAVREFDEDSRQLSLDVIR